MSLSSEDLAFLRGLQEELNMQPTLGTADPRFWVIMDYEYVPTDEWVASDTIDFNGHTLDVADFLDCIYGEVLEQDGLSSITSAWTRTATASCQRTISSSASLGRSGKSTWRRTQTTRLTSWCAAGSSHPTRSSSPCARQRST